MSRRRVSRVCAGRERTAARDRRLSREGSLMQPRNTTKLDRLTRARGFVLSRDWRDRRGRSFLDSRVAAFLADARYSRSGAACTDYAQLRHGARGISWRARRDEDWSRSDGTKKSLRLSRSLATEIPDIQSARVRVPPLDKPAGARISQSAMVRSRSPIRRN